MSLEDFFPYLFLMGIGLAIIGWLALLVVAFRVRMRWGFGVMLFPPAALAFMFSYTKKALIPIGLMLVGGVLVAGPPLYVRLIPIDLGPREKQVGGELHLTLTGWDRKDYSVLTRKPATVILQMANPDVTDATLSYVKGMSRLRELDLNGTKVTDLGLAALQGLPSLETLRLRDTGVTDAGFRDVLATSETLKQLDLRGTAVTREAVRAWKDAKPGRRVMQ
ncbi:leucine-rich repeat domain-containing protein [Singulisphaera sp. Ch08]|uniref:Leucine-rich repeat domain-containing protein n=1 Tax=Singulisphaera sp. Ch08 TaxID=3120278 RepID=A0AAU7CC48_9BACT